MGRVVEAEDNAAQARALSQYCNQKEVYPSASKGLLIIDDMEPVHAFNAWRRMRMLLLPTWPVAIKTDLSVALLNQAFDGAFDPDRLVTELTLEMVFDALEAADLAADADKPLHPITRARLVLDYLTEETHA